MNERMNGLIGMQTFTDEQIKRMAKELIVKALGTTHPSPSQMDLFINTLIENRGVMKSLVKQAEQIIKEESLLIKFDEKVLKN